MTVPGPFISAVVLAASALAGCGLRHEAARSYEGVDADAAAPVSDTAHCSGGVTWARRMVIRESLDRAGVDSFARLTPAQREQLSRLTRLADQRLELLLEADRMLVSLPDGHPAGPAELLLLGDLDEAVLYLPLPRRRQIWSLDALPDLLDGAAPRSRRDDFELELAPIQEATEEERRAPRKPERVPDDGRRAVRSKASAQLQYFAQVGRAARPWSIRLQLSVLRVDDARGLEQHPLEPLTLGLPLLAGEDGSSLLRSFLGTTGGPLLGWQVVVTNESKPARPVQLQAALEDRGFVRVPLLRFCARRHGYREGPPRPTAERAGLALVGERELAGLRASKASGALDVHNRSELAAWVYADGVLLGWVGAGKRLSLRGLPEGFYRIYARTPTGVRAWGPFETYVPGPLTLW